MGFLRSTLEDLAWKLNLMDDAEMEGISDKDLESAVVKAYAIKTGKNLYDDDRHRKDVIDYIVNRSSAKLCLNAPSGEAFEGLLTVSSIQEAQRYYKLFKQFVAEGKVKEDIRKILPDFPKVAITYTVGENEDGATANQSEMAASIADYNAMLGSFNPGGLQRRFERTSCSQEVEISRPQRAARFSDCGGPSADWF